MKRSIAFAVMILGLSALSSGVRTGGVAAYMTCYDGECVHELIAEHALDLYSNDEILANYGSIDYGVGDEDEEDLVWDHTGACTTITHFWDADNGPDDEVTSVFCNGANAWQKARVLWGMALGEYHSGDMGTAYFYLGHVAHLLADMTVPAHAHEDMHPFADAYEDWMTEQHTPLSQSEREGLLAAGPVEIPDWAPKLYWLFYTTNQVGDFDASDDFDGDSDDPLGWADFSGLINDPECRSEDGFELGDCNLEVVRSNSYLYAIRATAALYKLFAEESKQQAALTVVIDTVNELECHDDLPIGCESGPDYFVRVGIGGYWFRNEGLQVVNTADIAPGWAFAQNVGLTGTTTVEIELWDEDEDPNPDDLSDIDPRDDDRTLALTVDLAKCVAGEDGAVSGDVGGTCGASLASAGEEDDRSQISFHIIAPNAPPTADAGPDQTVDENGVVTLNGSFTDPNVDDTHTFLWHLESSSGTNCVDVPDATTQTLTFTPIDDCGYTFTFTVTDNHGAQGSDTVVVTVVNVPPAASIDSVTDEYDEGPGHTTPVALLALDVELEGSFTDVGVVDTHTASLDWGDGEVYTQADLDSFSDSLGWATGTAVATHAYLQTGTFDITFTVTDDDAGEGAAMAQIEVIDAATAAEMAIDDLKDLAQSGPPFWPPRFAITSAVSRLNIAVKWLERPPPYWPARHTGLTLISWALADLAAAERMDPTLDLSPYMQALAQMAKSEAYFAIAQAGDAEAEQLAEDGDALLAAGRYREAVDKYRLVLVECWNS
jgi:hypothetical protein